MQTRDWSEVNVKCVQDERFVPATYSFGLALRDLDESADGEFPGRFLEDAFGRIRLNIVGRSLEESCGVPSARIAELSIWREVYGDVPARSCVLQARLQWTTPSENLDAGIPDLRIQRCGGLACTQAQKWTCISSPKSAK